MHDLETLIASREQSLHFGQGTSGPSEASCNWKNEYVTLRVARLLRRRASAPAHFTKVACKNGPVTFAGAT
jgi:hypothetical protein